ncbi:MAG: homoserine kinase [Roseiflexus sp.]
MLTSSDITHVLSRYNLGPVEGIAATGHGFVNETAIVVTRCGRFVVRRNHHRFSPTAVRYRHHLIEHLCRRSFPTARLIPNASGSTITIIDGRIYEVQEYIHGTDFDPHRPGQIAEVGATLACYHQAVTGFPSSGNNTLPRYAPARITALTETLYERDVMGELHADLAWYDARAAALRRAMPDQVYAALPQVLIHGDMHPDNVRFASDRVAALLDFDQVERDARIVDLADALVGFTTRLQPSEATSWGVFRGPLDIAQTIILVCHYGRIAPLLPGEVAALPVLIEVLWLRGELGRVISTPEGAPDYHAAVLAQGKRLSEWIQQHTSILIDRWSDAAIGHPGALAA